MNIITVLSLLLLGICFVISIYNSKESISLTKTKLFSLRYLRRRVRSSPVQLNLNAMEIYIVSPPSVKVIPNIPTSHITTGSQWRLVTSKSLTRDNWGWEIETISFYSASDCSESSQIPTNNGTATDSKNAGIGWGPSGAYTTSPMAWYGIPNDEELIWIGYDFYTNVTIQCIVFNQIIPTSKIYIHNRWEKSRDQSNVDDDTNWRNVMVVDNLVKGINQIITIGTNKN